METYLTKMSKTFFDKAWFMSHLSEDITTIVDFGCADGSFMKFLKLNCPAITYIGIDNSLEFKQKTIDNGEINANNEMLTSYDIKIICLDGKYSLEEANKLPIVANGAISEITLDNDIFEVVNFACEDHLISLKTEQDKHLL